MFPSASNLLPLGKPRPQRSILGGGLRHSLGSKGGRKDFTFSPGKNNSMSSAVILSPGSLQNESPDINDKTMIAVEIRGFDMLLSVNVVHHLRAGPARPYLGPLYRRCLALSDSGRAREPNAGHMEKGALDGPSG